MANKTITLTLNDAEYELLQQTFVFALENLCLSKIYKQHYYDKNVSVEKYTDTLAALKVLLTSSK